MIPDYRVAESALRCLKPLFVETVSSLKILLFWKIKMQNNYLVVAALREEMQNVFELEGIDVLFTGIGKVNAAYTLSRELMRRQLSGTQPLAVLNFGTAGSPIFKTHELVECVQFAQRDMDLTPLGFEYGATPFEDTPVFLDVPKRLKQLPRGVCGTGDSFETSTPKLQCNVVDMEAFALAKICRLEKIPFLSVKYITDGSDHNASNDWNENLPQAAASFAAIYREILESRLFEI